MTQRLAVYYGPIHLYNQSVTGVPGATPEVVESTALLARVLEEDDHRVRLRSISVPFVINGLCIVWEADVVKDCIVPFVAADTVQLTRLLRTAEYVQGALPQEPNQWADVKQILTQSRLFSTWEVK